VPAVRELARARFPGDEQEPRPREVVIQRGEQRRHAAQRGDAVLAQEAGQVGTEQVPAPRLRHERGPGQPRHPGLLDGEVERHRQPHLASGEPGAAFRGDQGLLVHIHDVRAGGGREPGEARVGQDHPDFGVGDDVGDPLRRESRVQRHVDGVRLERAEHADVAVHRVVEQQADPRPGPNAKPADQEPRDPVGRRVKLVVGQPAGRAVDREVAVAAGPAQLVAVVLEQVLKALAVPPPDGVVSRRREDRHANAGIEHHGSRPPPVCPAIANLIGVYTVGEAAWIAGRRERERA